MNMVSYKRISPNELKKNGIAITYGVQHSPFGWFVIGVADKKICQLAFLKTSSDSEAVKQLRATWTGAKLIKNNLATKKYADSIFKNSGLQRPIHLLLKGTDFQIKVWDALLHIPKGKTVSYAQLAKTIKSPRAVRAVGNACGKNALPFIIPCHRVLASNGSLGGYSGGLPRKKAMLAAEK
jgi:AraC family transcriptional regulator of adaptative response/methylated-DNA-[protein]-cysteine methyltransferase